MVPRARCREHRFTDELLALDVRRLHRDGCLKRVGAGPVTVTWSGPGGSSSIDVFPGRTEIRLNYTVFVGEDREERSERVVIGRTACNFGGSRVWWFCPRCGRRCAILYGGRRFLCRHCRGIRYRSQNQSKSERLLAKAEGIRARLGGSGVVFDPFPERPAGMHWRTYHRLRGEAEEAKAHGLALTLGALGSRRRRAWY
jgi:hypothetical protein